MRRIVIPALLFLFYFNLNASANEAIEDIYQSIEGEKPSYVVFEKAIIGYEQISEKYNNRAVITIIDFSLPSTEERLWVIDLDMQKTLMHTFVSHGIKTGELYATDFSNNRHSNQSSLGFYLTAEPYYGRNGYSMRLDGLESEVNDNARARAIVVHGAWYADPSIISKTGRLGRSFGCPAVPTAVHKQLIDTISNQSVLFIYADIKDYFNRSSYFSPQQG
jgi:hypothetical protein